MVTRRCTQRQFLLRPDDELNNAFLYCLIEAALRYDIGLIHSTAMSNHHHTTLHDRGGTISEFMEHFHKMLAKCVNWMRGRWENCWASESPSAVRLVQPGDVVDKVAYAATNPVKDGLVEDSCDWPGVNTLDALLEDRELRATRPGFFSEDGVMPAEVSIKLQVPSRVGDRAEFLETLRARVFKVESRWLLIRAVLGRKVLGRARVRQQSWRSAPTSHEPRRVLRPRVAARSKWSRIEALQRDRTFQLEYARARKALVAGTPIPFPPGTYWLKRFAGVTISSSSASTSAA